MGSSLSAQFESIRIALSRDKPGKASHVKLSSVDGDDFEKYYEPSSDAHRAAVMLLLTQRADDREVVFMRRAYHKHDKHSGQISFPGGRMEQTDESLLACALRETHEEIGISPNKIEVLGELSSLYVFASNHIVQPYVGYFNEPSHIRPNHEVAEVIFGSIQDFIDDGTTKTTLETNGIKLRDVPYYNLKGHILWGATAMILTEFLDITRDISIL